MSNCFRGEEWGRKTSENSSAGKTIRAFRPSNR